MSGVTVDEAVLEGDGAAVVERGEDRDKSMEAMASPQWDLIARMNACTPPCPACHEPNPNHGLDPNLYCELEA